MSRWATVGDILLSVHSFSWVLNFKEREKVMKRGEPGEIATQT